MPAGIGKVNCLSVKKQILPERKFYLFADHRIHFFFVGQGIVPN